MYQKLQLAGVMALSIVLLAGISRLIGNSVSKSNSHYIAALKPNTS
jgi:hypothetical protein